MHIRALSILASAIVCHCELAMTLTLNKACSLELFMDVFNLT